MSASLPGWSVVGTALCRRSGIALQGVHLEGSTFSEAFVPVSFIQVLSEPFSHLNLTLGSRLSGPNGAERWLEGSDEQKATRQAVEALEHLDPDPAMEFDEMTALAWLEEHPADHLSWKLGRGALLAVIGRLDEGREQLEIAKATASNIAAPWARELTVALEGWLRLGPEALPDALRHAADATAEALGLRSVD